MLPPVRCYTCTKPIGHLFDEYLKNSDKNQQELLDSLGLKRWCCRMMFVGYSSVDDILIKYPHMPGERMLGENVKE
jgi:DNA-directed RNA polymerase subunit N